MAEKRTDGQTIGPISFNKGMTKDYSDLFHPDGTWSHARNAVNSSFQGDVGVLSNEQSNFNCLSLPYTIIGTVHLSNDEWVIFSTNDFQHEIGIFKENLCGQPGAYRRVVNGDCLNFNKNHLITGASRENFDCTKQIYWDDGFNPSRTMNLDEPPYLLELDPDLSTRECPVYRSTGVLDCDKLRLAPKFEVPCIGIEKSSNSGIMYNGSYQVALAYSINGQKYTDYVALSNIVSLFEHENVGGSIDISISNLEKEIFDEYQLVIIMNKADQAVANILGYYNVTQDKITIDAIPINSETVELKNIPVQNSVYDKTDAMFKVDDYLVRVAPTEKFDFNYQPQANKIKAKWVAVEYPGDYYKNSGANVGYARDEQYAFFIRWVYDTGDKSAAYHIPGRIPTANDTQTVAGVDVFDNRNRRWQVYNTATVTSFGRQPLPDGGVRVASGAMGYWQSTELYPTDAIDRWGNLCGKPIRHHKFPDDGIYNRHSIDGKIFVMGVEFTDITPPVDNDGAILSNVVGYEILRGSRLGNKTIIAKGLITNMGIYNLPGRARGSANNEKFLFQNYPFNDLRPDPYLVSEFIRGGSALNNSERNTVLLGQEKDGIIEDGYAINKRYFAFHSPEMGFIRPFLSASELRVYNESVGVAEGKFMFPSQHPKNTILTNFSGILAFILGLGRLDKYLKGERTITAVAPLSPTGPKTSGTLLMWGSSLASAFGFDSSIGIIQEIKSSDFNTLPGVLRPLGAIPVLIQGLSEGTDHYVNAIYNILRPRQHAVQHVAHGYYNGFRGVGFGNLRRKIVNSAYVSPTLQQFDAEYKVNNLYRSKNVVINVGADIQHPTLPDTSRYTIGQFENWKNLEAEYKSNISAYYTGLKLNYENQYGQIDSVIMVPTTCMQRLPSDIVADQKITSPIIFGGDVYIARYTEKNTMFFFNTWMTTQPDETPFDYSDYMNVPFARYWMRTERWSMNDFFSGLGSELRNFFDTVFDANRDEDASAGEDEVVVDNNTRPSNLHNLDNDKNSVGLLFSLGIRYGYVYLFNSGIKDFFVESEVNVAFRDHDDRPEGRHYDYTDYTDLKDLFDIKIIKTGNSYKYDFGLSISRFPTLKYSHSYLQPRYYDPKKSETCYTYRDNRIIYSFPNKDGAVRDPWKVFLTNNYSDFGSKVSSVKISVDGSGIILFENDAPVRFLPQDTLQLDLGTKLTVGDGELFTGKTQSTLASDDGYEYATGQSKFGVTSTPTGIFWLSSVQGKIFQYANGVKEISRENLKWWISKYLPFKILEDFPDFSLLDNTVNGVGVSTIYDSAEEIIYFSKKDYSVKPEFKSRLRYLENNIFVLDGGLRVKLQDTTYFNDASWTLSYDLKIKSWVSYHDWHPNFMIPGQSHFMTIKDGGIWMHNDTCQSYCNYYGIDYPFEVELLSNSGQTVSTLRSVEYQLESYIYKQNCADAHHVLDHNFDRAVIHNTEQVSGLLKLNINPKNDVSSLLQYPKINVSDIDILYSKEENKYRFNQFWDVTKDRGEFTSIRRNIWDTAPNGYIRTLNPANTDYVKFAHERKKFRHYHNHILLKRNVSGNVHMMLNLANLKIQYSPR
jgi:hypothetical protein